MTGQEIIGVLTVVIGLIGAWVYFYSIVKGRTKPHLFTWIIWSILTTIGFAAQIADHAGPGSWALGVTVLFSWMNALLSLKYGEKHITTSDRLAFAASLSAIVPWLLTSDPLGSVIMISLIDVIGFYPTFRKSWKKPYEENLTAYYFANAKLGLSLFALSSVTLVSALYPITIVVTNTAFILMCHILRRKENP